MYHGYYEKRVPNATTELMLDANVHLFQMGKVGLKSIEVSLLQAGHKRLIPHLHWADELIFTYSDCFYGYQEIIQLNAHRELLFISGVRVRSSA